MTTIPTAKLFAPIQDALAAVEEQLHRAVDGQHPALATATEHLLHAGGKRIRPAICLLTAGIFTTDIKESVSLAVAVEMLHTATIVHDDVIDRSLLRRGAPTLNANWSPDVVILTGDYLFARSASLIAQTDNVRVMNLFAQTLMTIVDGEIKQKFAQGIISRDAYHERIYAKTAAMFVLATEAAATLGDADEASLYAIREYGRSVGMAYQIVDDVFDFVGTPDQIGKPIGSDLRQGLFTLPAIHYVQAHPDDPDVKALLNGGVEDRGTIPRVIAAVCKSGAVAEAMQEAREFVAQAQLALKKLPDSAYVTALSAVSQYIVNRDL